MADKVWWKRPLRVIQTNLQVKDTPLMDPAKIAQEIKDMGGNVLVTNVGGIYAWYQSNVKHHHVNEYLPREFDLLQSLIDECRKLDIRLVARFDFSKAEDRVYQERPQWFVRNYNNVTRGYGIDRPGDWSLLYTTCINGGYRGQDVAVPVIRETLERYDIDGIFFNAPHYELCYCDSCRRKYLETYGVALPAPRTEGAHERADSPTLAWHGMAQEMEPDWASVCVRDNIRLIHDTIQESRPNVPMILYYNLYKDNIFDRTATAEMICTESQDVLSLGQSKIPQTWHPALSMKMGRTPTDYPAPFGIIHSCPGMDWRHTGLPPAEYRAWMAQIPANGGSIWHSITGFPDTITDKRVLRCVSDINHMTAKTEADMDGAESVAKTLLVWNSQKTAEGWAEALVNTHRQFDVLAPYQLDGQRLGRYSLVIVPSGSGLSEEALGILQSFVENGGSLLLEEVGNTAPVCRMAGVRPDVTVSEYLAASYFRFEDGRIQNGFEETPLLAHRGAVAYCVPEDGTGVLATLVPPFAPLDAVGAPPERASILTEHTDLPLCTLKRHGKGNVMFLPFELGSLAVEFKLAEHYGLMRNCVSFLLGDNTEFETDCPSGVQAAVYQNGNRLLAHFVNGIGQRPLVSCVACHDLQFSVKCPQGTKAVGAQSRIAGEPVSWECRDGWVHVTLAKLDVWDMVSIDLQAE